MNKLEQKVLRFIDEKNLIEKNDKILVGLSGGPDSVLLLHLLIKFSQRFKIITGAVHINHLIRGKEAD
ncbi:MAG TPA: ATP-binding protein, partial [Ignavibacteriaceae bacterium]|nr:ATP-binding protein [Ignavibacteriaceae bacterium]